MSYQVFPTRTISDHFDASNLDEVSKRFFLFLTKKDGLNPLIDTHYMDLMNYNIKTEYREPYFILADISDYSSYSYKDIVPYHSKNGYAYTQSDQTVITLQNPNLINYNIPNISNYLNKPIEIEFPNEDNVVNTTISNIIPTIITPLIKGVTSSGTGNFIALETTLIPNQYAGKTFRLQSGPDAGYYDIISNTTTVIKVDHSFSSYQLLNASIHENEFTHIIVPITLSSSGIFNITVDIPENINQGNKFTDPRKISGRGTISISLDHENSTDITYKINIITLPIFLDWAYFVLRYLKTGSYNIIKDVTT